ncbi:MAG: type II toxin-antitoxin system VapC family toxin [Longimicrobiales bacterium]|nr:type II toxin-antitoxin system VapC family toxin [Longimicrobiales bacterium]
MSARYLLDTNILSEPARPAPAKRVVEWLRSRGSSELAISVLVLGEIAKGVAMMEPGRRKDALTYWLEHDLPERFRGRLLPVDDRVAFEWGRLAAEGRRIGRPLPVIDGLMLATAVAHDLTLATRNIRDCGDRGVPVFDPWRGE